MSTSWTYATLKSEIQEHVENTDAAGDLADNLDTIIALAEDKVIKDMDLEIFDSEENVTIASAVVTKPASAIAVRDLYYLSGTERKYIEPKSRSYCLDYWPNLSTTAAAPKFWSEYSATELLVVPTVTASISGKALVIKRPTGLSSVNTTTWLGTNVGDVLFYACLVCTERFEVADERLPTWQAAYQDALNRALIDLRHLLRKDYASGTMTAQAQGER